MADGHWLYAATLQAGDRLLNADGTWAKVLAAETVNAPMLAYNLTVEGFHTYFVAANEDAAPVWVHNECVINVNSFEIARNRALADIGDIDPSSFARYEARSVGSNNILQGKIVGFTARTRSGDFVRMRVDWDPVKGAHINVEIGKNKNRITRAYIIEGATQEEALAWALGNLN